MSAIGVNRPTWDVARDDICQTYVQSGVGPVKVFLKTRIPQVNKNKSDTSAF